MDAKFSKVEVAGVRTLEQALSASLSAPRYRVTLLGLFAVIALLLASIGIYGVIAYTTTQRTHELGVRIALGAQSKDVLKLVIGQGLKLTLAGVLLGFGGALGLTRF